MEKVAGAFQRSQGVPGKPTGHIKVPRVAGVSEPFKGVPKGIMKVTGERKGDLMVIEGSQSSFQRVLD